jgi:hypothetical protein
MASLSYSSIEPADNSEAANPFPELCQKTGILILFLSKSDLAQEGGATAA